MRLARFPTSAARACATIPDAPAAGRAAGIHAIIHIERGGHMAGVTEGQAGVAARPTIVFDYDGTLADTSPAIMRVARQVLSAYGMTDEQMGDLRRLIGPPFPLGYTMVYGIPPKDAERLTARYREIFGTLGVEDYPLFGGMRALLERLRDEGRHLAVASSKRDDLVRRMLAEQGVLGLFDAVRGADDHASADKTAQIQRCLAAMGASPDDAVMVGDRCYDAQAARRAGMPCVGVLYGGTAERAELVEAGVVAIATTVGELADVLG